MIILVYLIIASPILAIIFFIFYKSFLVLKEISKRNSTQTVSINSNINVSPQPITPVAIQTVSVDNSEEITSVITAAVSYYFKQNKIKI